MLRYSAYLCASKFGKFDYSTSVPGCTSVECLLYNVFLLFVIHCMHPAYSQTQRFISYVSALHQMKQGMKFIGLEATLLLVINIIANLD